MASSPAEVADPVRRPAAAAAPAAPAPRQRLSAPELMTLVRARLARRAGERMVLMVVALNRSDRLSALAGEPDPRNALAEIGRRVESMLRSADRYAFASHDEVWVMLPDLPTESLAELAGRTLVDSLSRPVHGSLPDGGTTVSQLHPVAGAAWCQGGSHDALALLSLAHAATIEAGRNDARVALRHLEGADTLINRTALERDLRAALQANALEVFFQPQVDLRSGLCASAEALVRWQRDGTWVNPALIASICEERGMMGALTQYVLNSALRSVLQWDGDGLRLDVSVNLSAVTLEDSTFPHLVAHALQTWSVGGDRVTLELTEGAIVRHEGVAQAFMRQVRDLGCRLAIDDFGTGYSSFQYLRRYPLSELKIDQTFVRGLASDRGDRQIVRALVDLAHTFGLRALAEGVEGTEVATALSALGCDAAQGYLYAPAMPAARFGDWVRTFNAAGAQAAGAATEAPAADPSAAPPAGR